MKHFARSLLRRPTGLVGLVLLVGVCLVAVLCGVLAPQDPNLLDVPHRLQPPGRGHLLGTDNLGRDVLSRVLFGTRLSLLAGATISVLSGIGGLFLGLTSAFYPGAGLILMRLVDALMAFPAILLALAITAITGGASLGNVIVALAVVYTPQMARIAYGVTLTIRGSMYVEACRACGMGDLRVILRHILPNMTSPLIVQTTFIFAWSILGAASLDFLGVGVPPELPSWGAMVNDGRLYITRSPWMIIPPGVCILVFVLALNLVGDTLRDATDPKLRRLL